MNEDALKETVSGALPPTKTKRKRLKPRRLNSALAGGTFVTVQDVALRWGVIRKTALARLGEAGIAAYHFSDQCVRFRIEDVVRYEESLRSQQLKTNKVSMSKL
jgi:hypothetical protein